MDTELSGGLTPLKHQARTAPKGPLERVFLQEEIDPGEITLLPDLPQDLLAFPQGAQLHSLGGLMIHESFLYIHNMKRFSFK